jgi:biotin transport system substrate-specific component
LENKMTAIEQVKPRRIQRVVLDVCVVLVYGLLIALSAQFRVPLPFSPVPITGQTLTVLLAGGILGVKRGTLAALAYLMMGFLGVLPFAGGSLLGPTGGYVIGFVVAVYFIGTCTTKGWTTRWWTTLIILFSGNIIIYLFGLPWLAQFVGWHSTLSLGFYPFLIGDLLKLACAFGLWRVMNL